MQPYPCSHTERVEREDCVDGSDDNDDDEWQAVMLLMHCVNDSNDGDSGGDDVSGPARASKDKDRGVTGDKVWSGSGKQHKQVWSLLKLRHMLEKYCN